MARSGAGMDLSAMTSDVGQMERLTKSAGTVFKVQASITEGSKILFSHLQKLRLHRSFQGPNFAEETHPWRCFPHRPLRFAASPLRRARSRVLEFFLGSLRCRGSSRKASCRRRREMGQFPHGHVKVGKGQSQSEFGKQTFFFFFFAGFWVEHLNTRSDFFK